jgi:D-alanine-D-alanine ligase
MDFRKFLAGKRIGVLMGGTSGEREVSLRSGKMVFESLLRQGFDTLALDVKNDAVDVINNGGFDVAFVMLHGRGGEDGTVQGILEQIGMPYTGSGVTASAISMNKIISKKLFMMEGIPTPEYLVLEREWGVETAIQRSEAEFDYPMVLKPINEGSSLGVIILHGRDEFQQGLTAEWDRFEGMFVERFIGGKCITVGILGSGKESRALPVLELVPKNEFYDYEAKYTSGMTEFICPAQLEGEIYEETQKVAVGAHRILGLQGFSRVDMQLDEDGAVFVLEVNSIPGMTELSDLPAEAKACGMSYDELVFEILKSSYDKKY